MRYTFYKRQKGKITEPVLNTDRQLLLTPRFQIDLFACHERVGGTK